MRTHDAMHGSADCACTWPPSHGGGCVTYACTHRSWLRPDAAPIAQVEYRRHPDSYLWMLTYASCQRIRMPGAEECRPSISHVLYTVLCSVVV